MLIDDGPENCYMLQKTFFIHHSNANFSCWYFVSMHASFDVFILAFCICWYRFNNYMKQQRSTISSDLILVRRCTNYFTHAIFLLRNQDIWDIEIQWHAYKTKSSVSLYFNITSQNSSRKCMMSYNYSIGHKVGKPTDQKVKLYLHWQ